MQLIVDKDIRDKYCDLRIGIIIARNVENNYYPLELEEYCKNTFSSFAKKFESPHDLDNIKNIAAWRETYKSFGINPKKKRPTAESLLTRAIKNDYYPHISAAVDSYLCAETINCLPIGGYDLNHIQGNIILRYSKGEELFLGVSSENEEKTIEGEIIYADESRILTRCWNYRDCDFAKIDRNTNTLALFIEAPMKSITDEDIRQTTELVAANLTNYCKAECNIKFLNEQQNSITLI